MGARALRERENGMRAAVGRIFIWKIRERGLVLAADRGDCRGEEFEIFPDLKSRNPLWERYREAWEWLGAGRSRASQNP